MNKPRLYTSMLILFVLAPALMMVPKPAVIILGTLGLVLFGAFWHSSKRAYNEGEAE